MQARKVSSNRLEVLRIHLITGLLAASIFQPQVALPQTQGGSTTFIPNKVQLQRLTLELQAIAKKCDDDTLQIARKIFHSVVAFRQKHNRFPASVEELKSDPSVLPANLVLPPLNPLMYPNLCPKELREELAKALGHIPETCKIQIEPDSLLSASFPISLRNIKLNPSTAKPGTIVVKYNGDYYLAVWCMGFDSKSIEDEKTQLPFLLFHDFSNLSE